MPSIGIWAYVIQIDNSPSSFRMKELQVAFNALYGECMKIAKRKKGAQGFTQEVDFGKGGPRVKCSFNGKWCSLTLRGKEDQCKSIGGTSKVKRRAHQASQGKGGHSQACRPICQGFSIDYINKRGFFTQEIV